MPPADVAVAALRRATAPMRRADDEARPRIARSGPSASPPAAAADRCAAPADRPVGSPASRREAGRAGRRRADGARSIGPGARGTDRPAEDRVGARGPGRTGARIGPPDGPRTWRRCCAPWAAMVPRSVAPCKRARRAVAHDRRRLRCQRATRSRRARSRAGRRATYRSSTSGACARSAARWARERADVAAGDRAGQGGARSRGPARWPASPRSAARRSPGAGLVEAGHPAELDDRVEQGHEPAGREDGRRVVRGLRAGREPRPAVAPIASAIRASRSASWSSPSIAIVAPWRAATARSVSAKATSGWNEPICVPAAIAGASTSAPSSAAGVDHRLAAVHPEAARQRRDRIVRDGEDDQLDLLDEGLGLDERPRGARPGCGTARAGRHRGWRRRGSASRRATGRRRAPSRRHRLRRSR